MIKIGGKTIHTPSSFKVDVADLDNSAERNANGLLIRDRIATKRKLYLEFPPMNDDEISKILSVLQAEFFTCEYPDPLVGGMRTMTCYVGDRSAQMYNFTLDLWEGLSFNLIER